MTYRVSLSNNKLAVSLSRTGGQGSKGDSVTNAYIDSNGDFHVVISNAAGEQVSDTNLGGANIISQAITAATNAETALDTFDDRFLGAKASAPSVDNDGDALLTGALYFDTTTSQLGIYNGTAWEYPAQEAQTSADSAANSLSQINTQVTDAANYATSANNSATAAATSATSAATSASDAATSATNAATSETNASTSETNAATSETNAATSETNAGNSATAAATSATSASNSATTATTKASEAEGFRDEAEGHKDSAATSASSALSYRNSANTAATNAAASASAASNSEANALISKNSAATSESNASTYASSASTSANNAATSETNAAISANNAASSASSASTTLASIQTVFDNFDDRFLGTKTADPTVDNDGNALVEGAMYYDSVNDVIKFYNGTSWEAPSVAASNSASAASTSASNAASSATAAANSATAAASSATTAYNNKVDAETALDNFEDKFFGALTSDPNNDLDGDPLTAGAMYFNTTTNVLRIYSGSAWVNAITEVVDDTTPLLGGNLDVNGNSIVSASGVDINITPGGGGAAVVISGLDYPSTDGTAGQFLKTDGAGNLSFDTVSTDLVADTTPQLGGNLDLNGNQITESTNGTMVVLDRTTSNGLALEIKDDGNSVGGIGVDTDFLTIGMGDSGMLFGGGGSSIMPYRLDTGAPTSNIISLGNPSYKWRDLYLSGSLYVDGTVDGRDVATDGTKLDGIAASATANPNAIDNVVEDTTPQLGGNLDLNSSDVTGAGNVNITGTITATSFSGDGSSLSGINTDLVSDTTPQLGGTLDTNGNLIQFGDSSSSTNNRLQLGASQDLEIYHDGTQSVIDSNLSNAYLNIISGGGFSLKTTGGTNSIVGFQSGGVSLYTNGNLKLATTTTGVQVTGDITVSGTVDGVDIATRDAVLTSTTTTANAAMPKAGGTFTGDVTFTGASYNAFWDTSDSSLVFNANAFAKFGSNGFNIKHNGANAYIGNDTGNIFFTNNANDKDIIFQSDSGSGGTANYIVADGATGEVQLYHYGSEKLATKSTGIDVTGRIDTSGTAISFNTAAGGGISFGNGYFPTVFNATPNNAKLYLQNDASNKQVFYANTTGMLVGNGSSPSEKLDVQGNIAVTGTVDGVDIATNIPSTLGTAGQVLTVNAGATAGEWASVSADLVNDTSPQLGGHLDSNGYDIELQSNDFLILGDNGEFRIGHSGTSPGFASLSNTAGNTDITTWNSTSSTRIKGPITSGMGEYIVASNANKRVQLYYDGGLKFVTTSSGIQTTGTVNVNNAYTLPTSDGTNGQVLTTDGSGAVTFADAGGILELYDENPSSPTANTITGTNAVAIGDGVSATGQNAVAIGDNVTASGQNSFVTGRSNTASALYSFAGGLSSTASGDYSFVYGNSNTVAGNSSIGIHGDTASAAANSVAIGNGSSTQNSGAIALGNSRAAGIDGFAAAIGNNSSSYGTTNAYSVAIGRLALASGTQAVALNNSTASGNWSFAASPSATASGSYSVALGYATSASALCATAMGSSSNGLGAQTSGSGAVALGGAYASGTDSFAAAIGNNSSSYGAKATGAIAMGPLAKTNTNTGSVAIGNGAFAHGSSGVALGASYCGGIHGFAAGIANASTNFGATGYNSIAMGRQAKSAGSYSISLGDSTEAGGNYSVAIGHLSNANAEESMALGKGSKATIYGQLAFMSGYFSGQGDAQTSIFVLRSDTTDATAEALTTDNSTASTDNQIILKNNSAYFFSGTCVARESAANGTDMGAWEFKGAIRREANAGTTTLVSSTIDEFSAPTGWSIDLVADTTNGGLKIEVTGAASTNIRWVATVNTSEVTYA